MDCSEPRQQVVPITRRFAVEVACPKCGTKSDLALPSAVSQPILDQLRFANPETLTASLRPNEVVLVQCHANVGGLVGTTQRVLVIKDGQAYEYAYTDIRDIIIEKVGWWLNAVCQITTSKLEHQPLKAKVADHAANSLSLLRSNIGMFESAKAHLLSIRKARSCPHCASFVPIALEELAAISAHRHLLDPIPAGGAGVISANLHPDERILCQVHGERYYKTMVITDQRVMIVQGNSQKRFHAFSLGEIEGVDLKPDLMQVCVRGRPRIALKGVARVAADDSILCDEGDLPKIKAAASLIEDLIKRQPAPAGAQR